MGELAQMVERPLRMREVPGSIPGFSKSLFVFIYLLSPNYVCIRQVSALLLDLKIQSITTAI